MKKIHTIIGWIGIIIFAVFIIFASTDPRFGANYMRTVLITYFPELSKESIGDIIVGFRKTFHFISYGVLAVFSYMASQGTRGLEKHPYISAGVIALGLGFLDEGLQHFQAFRTGAVEDVLINSFGILSALYIIKIFSNTR